MLKSENMNRMNPKALAVVFAPNLVSMSEDNRAHAETQKVQFISNDGFNMVCNDFRCHYSGNRCDGSFDTSF